MSATFEPSTPADARGYLERNISETVAAEFDLLVLVNFDGFNSKVTWREILDLLLHTNPDFDFLDFEYTWKRIGYIYAKHGWAVTFSEDTWYLKDIGGKNE